MTSCRIKLGERGTYGALTTIPSLVPRMLLKHRRLNACRQESYPGKIAYEKAHAKWVNVLTRTHKLAWRPPVTTRQSHWTMLKGRTKEMANSVERQPSMSVTRATQPTGMESLASGDLRPRAEPTGSMSKMRCARKSDVPLCQILTMQTLRVGPVGTIMRRPPTLAVQVITWTVLKKQQLSLSLVGLTDAGKAMVFEPVCLLDAGPESWILMQRTMRRWLTSWFSARRWRSDARQALL
mmetsp:Transcript_76605/g.211602  ORF Transcript_76605/g.211602 Transcript_76605/m.211602 type:complete len:238 (-) Transcript_76605:6310-7023(-)